MDRFQTDSLFRWKKIQWRWAVSRCCFARNQDRLRNLRNSKCSIWSFHEAKNIRLYLKELGSNNSIRLQRLSTRAQRLISKSAQGCKWNKLQTRKGNLDILKFVSCRPLIRKLSWSAGITNWNWHWYYLPMLNRLQRASETYKTSFSSHKVTVCSLSSNLEDRTCYCII